VDDDDMIFCCTDNFLQSFKASYILTSFLHDMFTFLGYIMVSTRRL